MFVPIFLALFFGSSVLAAYDKPFYKLEEAETHFKEFLKEHKKVYSRREYYERLEVFKENLKDINERNAKFPDTVFDVNYFADLHHHELNHLHGLKISNETIEKVRLPLGSRSAPEEFDWRNHKIVSPVKNQGHCGSCFIFSAIGNVEGQYALKHNQCLAFSEQQAIDCLDCGGCLGGFMGEALGQLGSTYLMKEADYPYKNIKQSCQADPKKGIARASGKVTFLDTDDEERLKNYLVNIGPLAIGVSAIDMHSYKQGILEPNKCTNLPKQHGMVLVGYGVENGKPFWTIKNSWGSEKGEKGYVRLLRGVKACGIGEYTATTTLI